MPSYADGDVLMMERTAALAVTSSLTAVTIPTISGSNGALIRPLYLEICESTADFNLRVNDGSDTGTTQAIVAADLSIVNRPLIAISANTAILLSTAATATVDVRWIYPVGAKAGLTTSIEHASILPMMSFSISVTNSAANITIPADAVEMVINTSAGGGTTPGITYAVGASGTPTPIVNVPAGSISYGAPYRIFIDDGDVLRAIRLGNTNQTITGFWRLAQ